MQMLKIQTEAGVVIHSCDYHFLLPTFRHLWASWTILWVILNQPTPPYALYRATKCICSVKLDLCWEIPKSSLYRNTEHLNLVKTNPIILGQSTYILGIEVLKYRKLWDQAGFGPLPVLAHLFLLTNLPRDLSYLTIFFVPRSIPK